MFKNGGKIVSTSSEDKKLEGEISK